MQQLEQDVLASSSIAYAVKTIHMSSCDHPYIKPRPTSYTTALAAVSRLVLPRFRVQIPLHSRQLGPGPVCRPVFGHDLLQA